MSESEDLRNQPSAQPRAGIYRRDRLTKRFIFLSIFAAALALVIFLVSTSSPPARGAVKENPKDGLRYVWVPSGDLQEGCSKFDSDCSPDEKPAHEVTISKGFWIGQTEVTVAAYRGFAVAAHRNMPPEPIFGGRTLNAGWSDLRSPIVNVDWNDAKGYCLWAGRGLPTEAQWEYAARAGDTTLRYGALPQIAWTADNAGDQSLDSAVLLKQDESGYLGRLSNNHNTFHAAGTLTPNPFGLYDMLGNVWEWTADWYGEHYYQTSGRFDPAGPPNGETKVLRGASWTNIPNAVRVSVRGRRAPVTRSVDTGFRCVL